MLKFINVPPAEWIGHDSFQNELDAFRLFERRSPGRILSRLTSHTIVDLGCGCRNGNIADHGMEGMFLPWFMRASWALGAKESIGVDMYDGDPENNGIYHHFKGNFVNMIEKGELISTLRNITHSPILVLNTRNTLGNIGETMGRIIGSRERARTVTKLLIEQAAEIVCKDGILQIENQIIKY